MNMWLRELKIQAYSEHTLNAYTSDLMPFFEYLVSMGVDLASIEASDLRSFIGHRTEVDGVMAKTIKRQIDTIRHFMRWATESGYLKVNTVQDIRINKLPRSLPKVMDVELVNRLLDQPVPSDSKEADLWVRDKSFMEIFYSSGLRLHELQSLNVNDIDMNQNTIRVLGKGNKERIVPVGSLALEALKKWYMVYREWGYIPERNAPIYISRKGDRLSDSQIARRVKYQALRAGMPVDVHPHLFRHCFATHMLEGSRDIRAVQEMLGHSSLDSTQIYTNLDFSFLASSYDMAHPRASKNKK